MTKQSYDRFDLEQAILECWSITSDVDLIAARPHTDIHTKELLDAASKLYHAKFEHLFGIFEQLVAEGKITR